MTSSYFILSDAGKKFKHVKYVISNLTIEVWICYYLYYIITIKAIFM